jgi:hypothetical protein
MTEPSGPIPADCSDDSGLNFHPDSGAKNKATQPNILNMPTWWKLATTTTWVGT